MMLALFACVTLHELAHVWVARRAGAKVRAVTLMMLGGVSEVSGIERARDERAMALAGPLASVALALVCYGGFRLVGAGPPDLRFGLFHLAELNLVLGVFNLLPAFPMDGGRVLRGALQPRLGRLRATRVAATVGQVLAVGLAALGLVGGNWWLLLIALFIFTGGQAESQALTMRVTLRGMRVADVYSPRLLPIPPDATVEQAAEAMLAARSEVGLVTRRPGTSLECVTAAELAAIPVRERSGMPVERFLRPLRLVDARTDLLDAIASLDEDGAAALGVVESGRLLGTLDREDVARALALRQVSQRPV
jgi:Zn-dependent protease/CBS domain-containing protein